MEKPYCIHQVYFNEEFSTLYIELHTEASKTHQWEITLLGVSSECDCIQIRNIGGTSERARKNTFKFVEKAGYWEKYKSGDKELTFAVRRLGDALCFPGWKETIQLHCGKYLNNQCHP